MPILEKLQVCSIMSGATVWMYVPKENCSDNLCSASFSLYLSSVSKAKDNTPGISGPSGEGIADVYTALRLADRYVSQQVCFVITESKFKLPIMYWLCLLFPFIAASG